MLGCVAHANPDKPCVLTRPGRDRRITRAQTELVADLVPLELIRAFVRTSGGGDRAAAWIAGRQLELITASQFGAVGIDQDAIATRRNRGSLHLVHRGVYLLGGQIMLPGAPELAAVQACGSGTWVSHRSAAALWGLVMRGPDQVEVTVIGHNRSRRDIRTHGVGALHAADRTKVRGIPITAPARALIDFAAGATNEELERAVAEAYARGLVDDRKLDAAIERAPGRAGVRALRALRNRDGGPQWTQSEAERKMLRLIRAARLPPPQTQVRIAGWPADFLWAEQRLIIEVDGYRFHGHRRAFERDRRRDQAHIAAGYRVIRVT